MTIFGACGNPNSSDTRGAKVIRKDASWSGLEPVQGQFNWTAIDSTANACRKLGVKWLPVFCYGTTWASMGDIKKAPESRFVPNYAFAAACILARHGDVCAGLEVWNEPNHPDFGDVSVDKYVAMFEAVRQCTTGFPIVCGSVTDRTGWKNYLQAILARCNPKHVSVHTYTVTQTPQQARDIIGNNRELWLTETGMHVVAPAADRVQWMKDVKESCKLAQVNTALAFSLDDPSWVLSPAMRTAWFG